MKNLVARVATHMTPTVTHKVNHIPVIALFIIMSYTFKIKIPPSLSMINTKAYLEGA